MGCWDAVELKDRLILSGFGVDRGDAPGVYEISFQAVMPSEIAGVQGRGTTPVIVFSDQGKTIQEVINKISRRMPRRISGSHAEVLIISEDLAKDVGIGRFIDLIERDSETRITMQVQIARGTRSKDLLAVTSPVSPITAYNITDKLRFTSQQYSHNFPTKIDETIRGMIVPGGGLTISGAVIKGNIRKATNKENIERTLVPAHTEVEGMAMFKGDKLAGWLDGDKSLGLAILKNKAERSVANLACHQDPSESISVESVFSGSKIHASVVDGTPHFRIEVKQEGTINEVTCPIKLNVGEVIRIYEKTKVCRQ